MKPSSLLKTLLVTVLILLFTFTTVGAQGDPPVIVDPGSGEKQTSLDTGNFTVQPEAWVPPDEPININGAMLPVSPSLVYVYTQRPTFTFYRNFQASKYEVQVDSITTGTTVYTYPAAGTCTAYFCSIKPPTKLSYKDIWNPVSGHYKWRVRALVDVWEEWSQFVDFGVLSKGFDDSFLTDPSLSGRWTNVLHGSFSWVKTDTKSWLKAPGETNWWSTIIAKDVFYVIDYSVRMKRKVNAGYPNAVIIWADIFPTAVNNEFHDGVYFQYSNNGYWAIWMMDEGVYKTITDWHASSAIVPYGWNELRIVGIYPYVDLWINGTYLGWVNVSGGPSGGGTGVSMVATNDAEPLMVDWIKAIPIQRGVYSEHDPAMELGLDPAPEGMLPWEAPED